jgi:hypothetical protein
MVDIPLYRHFQPLLALWAEYVVSARYLPPVPASPSGGVTTKTAPFCHRVTFLFVQAPLPGLSLNIASSVPSLALAWDRLGAGQ